MKNMKRTNEKGFTLIELMIVIAIIGILASIALPAYQQYMGKAKFSEIVLATTDLKTSAELCFQNNAKTDTCKTTGGELTAVGASGKVLKIEVTATTGATGVITITATAKTGNGLAGETYITKGTGLNGKLVWEHKNDTDANGGTCVDKGFC